MLQNKKTVIKKKELKPDEITERNVSILSNS
jgi:hypothetical protein